MSFTKKISFRHISGAKKTIPGVSNADLSPKLVQRYVSHPEAGAKQFPVMQMVKGHVVNIVLLNEDYEEMSEADKNLPPIVRDKIENDHAAEMLLRREANQKVRGILQHYARNNAIEIISETDLDAQDVLDTTYPIISLSEIALADHEARGIAIPAKLQTRSDTERIRAAEVISKEKTAAKKAKSDDELLAEMEAEEAKRKK